MSHLPGPRHLLPCQKNTLQLRLANDLSVLVCKNLQDLSSCLNLLSLQKSKSYFLFIPNGQLYIAPCTIANLGVLTSWMSLAYCLNSHPRAARAHSHPTGSCLRGAVRKRGNKSGHFRPTHPGPATSLLCNFK